MSEPLSVSIVGASGYTGGELLRILLDHPHVVVRQVTSERSAGSFVHFTHPNLRGRTKLQFVSVNELEPADLLFLCLPHGSAMSKIEHFAGLAPRIVDLSADFRLKNPDDYVRWYGKPHSNPAWLEKFVYGLPELYRDQIAGAELIAERARVVDAHTVELLKSGRKVSAARILVATGGHTYRPKELKGQELGITSTDAFLLEQLPKSILILGGGYIALEFATIFSGLGVETVVAYRGEQLPWWQIAEYSFDSLMIAMRGKG